VRQREDEPNVPYYFVSDIHLRNDRPDRDRRFLAWLRRLTPADNLVIAGDLCDFWMGARRAWDNPLASKSLQSVAQFSRQGGALAIMPGNHDEWLCPYYETELGARIIAQPFDMTVHGLRLRLVHGHLLGARRAWKSWMESRAFFNAFAHVPRPVARRLDQILAWRNLRGLEADEARHLRVYRQYREHCRGSVDIVLFGHVHRPVDETDHGLRLIVLGGWQHRSSYLKIDETGATFYIEEDRLDDQRPLEPSFHLPSTHRIELDED
jgi:UDP-2,3-diacylglucosamine hydrolase